MPPLTRRFTLLLFAGPSRTVINREVLGSHTRGTKGQHVHQQRLIRHSTTDAKSPMKRGSDHVANTQIDGDRMHSALLPASLLLKRWPKAESVIGDIRGWAISMATVCRTSLRRMAAPSTCTFRRVAALLTKPGTRRTQLVVSCIYRNCRVGTVPTRQRQRSPFLP